MNIKTYTLFFASLAVLTIVSVLGWTLLCLFDPKDRLGVRKKFSPLALEIAAAIAITSTVGSLILQALKFPPCTLCWVQRGFMYPMALLLPLELLRRRTNFLSRPYFAYLSILLSIGGLPVSIFHRYEQSAGTDIGGMCDPDNLCSTKYVEHFFGLITIPTMAGIGFVGIVFFLGVYLFDTKETSN